MFGKSLIKWIETNECYGYKHAIMITDNSVNNNIISWCIVNFTKVKIEIRRERCYSKDNSGHFEWVDLLDIDSLNSQRFAGRIRIWFKDDIDAMAFKLRWL